jgi:GNAT superfamily N-acetyltransferase
MKMLMPDDTQIPRRPDPAPEAVVRPASPADIPALFAVRTAVRENHLDMAGLAERGVTHASMAELLASPDWRTWVVEEDGAVCGFSTASARSGSIFALFVAPEAEGKGFGRALLRVAESWLFESGRDPISLQTAAEHGNRAHGFYRAAGWAMRGEADHGDVRYEKSRSL